MKNSRMRFIGAGDGYKMASPQLKTVKRLGIDFPEVIKLLRAHGINYRR